METQHLCHIALPRERRLAPVVSYTPTCTMQAKTRSELQREAREENDEQIQSEVKLVYLTRPFQPLKVLAVSL